jgi:hypothetical protein
MNDFERLEFIKHKIKYMFMRLYRQKGKNQFFDDLIWLIEKAENDIKRKDEKNDCNQRK